MRRPGSRPLPRPGGRARGSVHMVAAGQMCRRACRQERVGLLQAGRFLGDKREARKRGCQGHLGSPGRAAGGSGGSGGKGMVMAVGTGEQKGGASWGSGFRHCIEGGAGY